MVPFCSQADPITHHHRGQCLARPHRNQGCNQPQGQPTPLPLPQQSGTLTREPKAMRSLGATGPTELSVTGRRYSSGWTHSQRLKLRAKASGYCSPRREMGVQGHGAIPNSSCLPRGGGPGRHPSRPRAGARGWGKRNRMSGVRSFQAPMPWLRTQRWTQRKERWGLSWADLLRDCPSIWVPLCFPHSHLPLKATNVPTPLPSPTERPRASHQVGRLEGPQEKGACVRSSPSPTCSWR